MAYIEPTSELYLMSGIPLSPDSEDTLYFNTVQAQGDYFLSHTEQALRFSSLTYQRVTKGVIRIQAPIASVQNANYCMFRNTSYGGKWFYAFVTSVEYVNDVTSEIRYELDNIQTWWAEAQCGECLVERETVRNDLLHEYLLPEPVTCESYTCDGTYGEISPGIKGMAIGVLYTGTDSANGRIIDGTYSGASLMFCHANASGVSALNAWVELTAATNTEIVTMFMVPAYIPFQLFGGDFTDTQDVQENLSHGYTTQATGEAITRDSTINGYSPRNKKLLSYPYTYFMADNANGSQLPLRYEFFDNATPAFQIDINALPPIQATLRPVNYKKSGAVTHNTESIGLQGYPLCSWSIDAFVAWLAQNSVPMATGLVSNSLHAMTDPAGAAVSGVSNAMSAMNSAYQAIIAGDVTGGSFQQGNVNYANGFMSFFGCRYSILREQAMTIDSFFDMYGYQVNMVKTPSRKNRTRWTYFKTAGATIYGNLPADAARDIEARYNRGIRFWNDTGNPLNYTADNGELD